MYDGQMGQQLEISNDDMMKNYSDRLVTNVWKVLSVNSIAYTLFEFL